MDKIYWIKVLMLGLDMTKNEDNLVIEMVVNNEIIEIRPVTGDDIETEKQFVRNHSSEGRYHDLLHQATASPDKTGESFHGIDYENKIAFVAVVKKAGHDVKTVGVARYATDKYDHCEAGVIVAEEWQNTGLDTRLMKSLIRFARDHHKELIYSIDHVDDSHMRRLARDSGMTAQRDPDDAKTMRYELLLS
jgi:GNAT superfamily N-acetyltransferase